MPLPRRSLVILRAATNAVVGGVLGRTTGPAGAVVGAVVAGAAGAHHGTLVADHHVYPATAAGRAALVVDHTWSLPNTVAGSLLAVFCSARGTPVDTDRSAGRTSLVFRDGVIPGYTATTIGPVEAGTTARLSTHEFTHVRQARWFGPFYGALVVGHYAVAITVPYWWFRHDHDRWPIRSFGDYLGRGVYRHVWHEAWAYRADGTGPATRPRADRARRPAASPPPPV